MLWSGSFASQAAFSLTFLMFCLRLALPHLVLILEASLDVHTPEVSPVQDRIDVENARQCFDEPPQGIGPAMRQTVFQGGGERASIRQGISGCRYTLKHGHLRCCFAS